MLSFECYFLLGEQKCKFYAIKLNKHKKVHIHCKIYKCCKQEQLELL